MNDVSESAAFTHLSEDGSATMVDVGGKAVTPRVAVARGGVFMSAATLDLLKQRALPKGDVLTVAKIAGIQAAKRTSELIPLCHPLALTFVDIRLAIQEDPPAVIIEAEAHTADRTGVEMEAMVAAQVAGLTIYDMCKAVQKDIILGQCRLVRKSGGKSGEFHIAQPWP